MPDTNSQLSVIASEVADTLDKLRTKERYVNSQNEPARIEYGKVRARTLLSSLLRNGLRCRCLEQNVWPVYAALSYMRAHCLYIRELTALVRYALRRVYAAVQSVSLL
jgi:hypothetical protein